MQKIELTYKEIVELKRASYLRGVNMSKIIIITLIAITIIILI